MKDTSKKALRRGHNEGNIRQRTDGRWEVRLSAGIDYKTGKPRRTSTCCNTRQEAIAILQQQAHEVRTQGWRDPMSVTLGQWYEYWLETYMKDTVKQSTYASYRSYLNKHFCVLGKILLKKLEPHTLQEFYNYKFREEGLSPKTLRNYHMALHKCLQQAVKERLLIYNPCDAVTLPSGEKPEISVFTNDQQRALVQASYRHRYGVFIRLDLCTGLRMGELLALKWEDIDFSTAQLHVRRTINRLAKYEAHDGENKTEIVFGTPKTKNSRRTIPLTRTMADELARWKQQQAQDKIRAGDKYTDYGFIVTNEFGHYFEQKTFKDYYDRLLKDADIGHFTFHALRHTFATRALERGMDYKTLSAILGHYSVAFTMDTYVHSMDEHKRCEMDKMNDMFGMQYSISVENQPYPVLCTLSADGCTAHVPDFPKIATQAATLDAALLEVKQQIEKALRHTFATRALERGMDYKTLSSILGHYSVAFTMDTYVHSMDEHKRNEMNKMDDMFGAQYSILVDNQPYPVICTITADGCTAHAPDFPRIAVHTATLDATLLEVKQQIQKTLHQYKYPPIPTRQEQIIVPDNSVLVLVKAG